MLLLTILELLWFERHSQNHCSENGFILIHDLHSLMSLTLGLPCVLVKDPLAMTLDLPGLGDQTPNPTSTFWPMHRELKFSLSTHYPSPVMGLYI